MKSKCILRRAQKVLDENFNTTSDYHFDILDKKMVFSPVGAIQYVVNREIQNICAAQKSPVFNAKKAFQSIDLIIINKVGLITSNCPPLQFGNDDRCNFGFNRDSFKERLKIRKEFFKDPGNKETYILGFCGLTGHEKISQFISDCVFKKAFFLLNG